jgi:hypothetical protein
VTLDHLFDLLFVLLLVIAPLLLAAGGLLTAVRTQSWFWRIGGYAVAVASTWLVTVSSLYVVRCPSQSCEENVGAVGDIGVRGLIALAVVYLGIVATARRWRMLHP